MSTTITGWRGAAKYVGDNVSPMKLRTLVKRGALRATKNAAGIYEFDTRDLDAIKATLALPAGAIATSVAIAAPSPVPVPLATAPAASSRTSAAIAPGSAPGGVIAPFLLAAAAARDAAVADDRDDADEPSHEPPFWASGDAATPSYPSGEPIGVCPTTRRIIYGPAVATASTHAPGTQGAQLQELQRQLVQVQAQLAQVCAERERWRTAWRRERIAGIANGEALQAAMPGSTPDVVGSVHAGVSQTLGALSDVQLGDDGVALPAARSAGLQWAAAQQQVSQQAQQQDGHSDIDLARARARRRALRRW